MGQHLRRTLSFASILFLAIAPASTRSLTNTINIAKAEKRVLLLQADRIFENTKIINFFYVFTKEPDDGANAHSIPNTKHSDYRFPIQRIKRHQDSRGVIKLDGVIYVRGDASAHAIPQINRFFSHAGGNSRLGTQYVVKIRFELAPPHITDAVEISWLSKSDLAAYASSNGLSDRSDDSKMIVGFTQLGGDVVKINPVYADARSIKLAFSSWPIDHRQLRNTIKHTRGVFAHEISHAMGLSHMSNQTKSIASYAVGRSVNGLDARAICLLVTNDDKLLCPE